MINTLTKSVRQNKKQKDHFRMSLVLEENPCIIFGYLTFKFPEKKKKFLNIVEFVRNRSKLQEIHTNTHFLQS